VPAGGAAVGQRFEAHGGLVQQGVDDALAERLDGGAVALGQSRQP
jgi:hypothetical protein